MDTPFKPDGLRKRKLKKILKKKPTVLNSSLPSNVYQKKVKAAINISLNSSRNVRTLQANNRSLANGLEKWKQQCRIAQDRCNYLLQTNHDLMEEILKLRRKVAASPSFIQEEVDRQYKLRIKKIQSDVCDLFQGLLENIIKVTSDTSRSSDLSPLNLDLPLSDLSLFGIQPLDEEYDDVLGPIYKRTKSMDLSLIAEQSVLLHPVEGLQESDTLERITEQEPFMHQPQEKLLSKLPLRVPVQKKKPEHDNSFERKKSSSPEKSLTGSPKATPKTGQPHAAKSPTKPLSLRESPKKKSVPLKAQHVNTRSPKSKIKSAKKTVQAQKLSKTSPKKDAPIITNEFALVNSHLKMMKKIQTIQLSLKDDLATKPPSTDGSHDLTPVPPPTDVNYDSNGKPHSTDDNGDCSAKPSADANHTNLSVVDMDLTRLVGADALPSSTNTAVTKPDADNVSKSSIDGVEKEISQGRDGINQSDEPVIDQLELFDLKFPDAVTLRRGKPGQILFAASRKESDGTRKNLPAVPPTKSRSKKKKIAEMSESFSESIPQSIFDFHDKTPKGLSDTKTKDVSIFNITSDVSTTSPLPSLSKFKQSLTIGEKTDSEIHPSALPKQISLLGDEPEYQMPLKGSPDPDKPVSKVQRRTRSQSRSKKRKDDDVGNTSRAHSESRNISVLSPDHVNSVSSRGRSKNRKSLVQSPDTIQSVSNHGRSKSRKSLLQSPDTIQSASNRGRSKSRSKDQQSPNTDIKRAHSRRDTMFFYQTNGTGDQSYVDSYKTDHMENSNNIPSRMSFLQDQPKKSVRVSIQSAWSSPKHISEIEYLTPEKLHVLKCSPEKENAIQQCLTELEKPQKVSLGIQKGKAVIKELKKRKRQKVSSEMKHGTNNNAKEPVHADMGQSVETLSQNPMRKPKPKKISPQKSNIFEVQAEVHSALSDFEELPPSDSVSQAAEQKDAPLAQCVHQENVSDETEMFSDVSLLKESNISVSKLPGTKKRPESKSVIKKAGEAIIYNNDKHSPLRKKSKKGELFKPVDPEMETNLATLPVKSRSITNKVLEGNQVEIEDCIQNRDSFEKVASQILSKVKDLKTPKMSRNGESDILPDNVEESPEILSNHREISSLNQVTSPQPSMVGQKLIILPKTISAQQIKINPKTLADIDPNTQHMSKTKPHSVSPALKAKRTNPDIAVSCDVPEIKKRRAATKIPNYAEFSLKVKLRRGDPISSHYCSSESIEIYKEKIRGKTKKISAHKISMESLHNLSIQEEN